MSSHEGRRDEALRRAISEIRELRGAVAAAEQARNEPIAIVGIACRLPGADDPAAFWELMCTETDMVTEMPSGRRSATEPAWRGAFLDQTESFDAAFFGISPREAAHMDPQQRLFLEVGWEALEDAGAPMDRLRDTRTGVFAGVSGVDYTLLLHKNLPTSELDGYVATGAASTFMAGRLSYWLGLQGPSLSLDTACSSSLVSVHLACQSLRAGDCDTALAGGVNMLLDPSGFRVMSEAGMLSPTAGARRSTSPPTATSAARAAASWCSSACPRRSGTTTGSWPSSAGPRSTTTAAAAESPSPTPGPSRS